MNEKKSNMSQPTANLKSDLNARDVELAERLTQALDASIDALDSDTRERLALIRHRALARTRKQRIAGAVALAASVLALAAMPWMLRQQPPQKIADDTAYLSVDPEMLEDMDMLLAIGESK